MIPVYDAAGDYEIDFPAFSTSAGDETFILFKVRKNDGSIAWRASSLAQFPSPTMLAVLDTLQYSLSQKLEEEWYTSGETGEATVVS